MKCSMICKVICPYNAYPFHGPTKKKKRIIIIIEILSFFQLTFSILSKEILPAHIIF